MWSARKRYVVTFCVIFVFYAILWRLEGPEIQARGPQGTAKSPLGRPRRVPEGLLEALLDAIFEAEPCAPEKVRRNTGC